MREKVMALKAANPSWGYGRIASAAGVSKSVVKYHLDAKARDDTRRRGKRRRLENVVDSKVQRFRAKKLLRDRVRGFQRRIRGKLGQAKLAHFTYKDVLRKLGANPVCYLTGTSIDLTSPKTYSFDHVVPAARGGSNTLKNLGILRSDVNRMKHDLTPDEFIQVCLEIARYAGYTCSKEGG